MTDRTTPDRAASEPRLDSSRTLYTIGHGSLAPRQLCTLLSRAGVEVVVDVRAAPERSRPAYRLAALRRVLREAGLRYLYFGDQLGGRPSELYQTNFDGTPNYTALAERPEFQAALGRLKTGIERYRIALLCAEEDPSRCHRRCLVGAALRREGIRVVHIRATGYAQTDAELTLGRSGQPLPPARPGRV